MGMWDHLPISALTAGTGKDVQKLCAARLTGSSCMVYLHVTRGGFSGHLGAYAYQWSRQ